VNLPDRSLVEIKLLSHRKIVNGHWLWTGGLTSEKYGVIYFDKQYLVTRISAWLYLGLDIDSKLLALHKNICHETRCFNPEHLYVGTYSDNAKDAFDLGTKTSYLNRTHCPQGHEYTKKNTYYYGNVKQCKICKLEQKRLYRLRSKLRRNEKTNNPNTQTKEIPL